LQTQAASDRRYKHTLDAVRTIYTTEGLAAFYRGLIPSLFGIAHVAVQFPIYEQFKAWASEYRVLLNEVEVPDHIGMVAETDNDTQLSNSRILLTSGASKMIASIATYPHEVIRTQLQIQKRSIAGAGASASSAAAVTHPGIVGTVREILHAEGGRGLYKGLSVNLLRTVPNSAVTMLTCVHVLPSSLGAAHADPYILSRYELLVRYLHDHH
jgi:solute carrier family 25 folate transporter 32